MCKVRQLDELLKQRKELDKQIKALQDEYISYMVANGVDKVYSEDNEKYIKLIHCDEKFMSYTKPAYDYVRVF